LPTNSDHTSSRTKHFISEGLKIVEEIVDTFSKLEEHHGIEIKKKLKYVLDKNIEYNIICKISKILSGKEDNITNLDLLEDMTAKIYCTLNMHPLLQQMLKDPFPCSKTYW
jgi:hypothetical protein